MTSISSAMGTEINVDIIVNNKRINQVVSDNISLLTFLRRHLKLTGTKNGCSTGHCGSCSIIFNGELKRSCTIKLNSLSYARIETIEALSNSKFLHPIQYSFIKYGAIQCGFCTPGMVIATKALLDKNRTPSTNIIKSFLSMNNMICRCTGYVKIIQAIKFASKILEHNPEKRYSIEETKKIRSSLPIKEAINRVTGKTIFADDLSLENMIYGKILWSKYPRAEIVSLNFEPAKSVRGIIAIISEKDIPGLKNYGYRNEKSILCSKHTRYTGDAIAVVFGLTPEIAKYACEQIKIKYKTLPGIFSADESSLPEAPKIHNRDNLVDYYKIERGNVSKVLNKCPVVIENEFSAPRIEHAYLEPESGVAFPLKNGGVVVKISTHDTFKDRKLIAQVLNINESKVRVAHMPSGGSFGGKDDFLLQPFLALGAFLTGYPVKITLTREESLRAHAKRHPIKMKIAMGADSNGNILALKTSINSDTGPYQTHGPSVLKTMVLYSSGPYYIPNLYLEGWMWYSNAALCGAMRAFGIPQVAACIEQEIDKLARLLKLCPFKIRMINALRPGLPTSANQILKENIATLPETLKAAQSALKKTKLPISTLDKKIGIGIASCFKHNGYGSGKLEEEGVKIRWSPNSKTKLYIYATNSDFGSSMGNALVQIAASEFKIGSSYIKYIGADTNLTPKGDGSRVSRLTFLIGNALILACKALKEKIFSKVSRKHKIDVTNLFFSPEGEIKNRLSNKPIPVCNLESLSMERRFKAPKTQPIVDNNNDILESNFCKSKMIFYDYSFNTQVAIVEVDIQTGIIRVLKVISAIDVGKALCPLSIEGQIHGGILMGIGYALSEKFNLCNGYPVTHTYGHCGVPKAVETPEILSIILEKPHPEGPYGAKGMGETTNIATTPAVLNAITNAIGIQINNLPAKPNKIRKLLKKDYATL